MAIKTQTLIIDIIMQGRLLLINYDWFNQK